MTVETASRLAQMRKDRGLSQEELAEKLGISRQAVSKWERAEASPDTDNLLTLAQLYGVSLDELLGHTPTVSYNDGEQSARANRGTKTGNNDSSEKSYSACEPVSGKDYVHIGADGIHVDDERDRVHISLGDGIRVDSNGKDHVHIGKDSGVVVNGRRYTKEEIDRIRMREFYSTFPFALVATFIFLVLGAFWNLWHPAWLVFLLIPIVSSLVEAIEKRNPRKFCYPVFATLVFLSLGFLCGMWSSSWVAFVTIPLFYSLVPKKRKVYIKELADKDEWDED